MIRVRTYNERQPPRPMFYSTIKSGSRHAEKSCKVLMMIKTAKLGWVGAGAGKKQGWSRSRVEAGTGQEQVKSR